MAFLLFPLAGALACALALSGARRRELGLEPRLRAEVFFAGAGFFAPASAWPGVRPAAPFQVRAYSLAGGGAPPPGARGLWLFGPKPARGSPGVLPFGGAGSPLWFQP